MRRALELMSLLADRAPHAGVDLAQRLGVTRAAVWHQIEALRSQGIEIEGSRDGYRLPSGFEALDAAAIVAHLRELECAAFPQVDVVDVTDSTNERLLVRLAGEDVHGQVLLAEHQTAGRGRRGDRWISPPGSGLCLSFGWRFDVPPATFSALSLVVGLAIVTSLRELGVAQAGLKWPNDILCDAGKLAGILIEMRAEAGGPCRTVIGIGINVALSAQARGMIDQPVSDLLHASGTGISRNRLAAVLLASLGRTLPVFAREGFAPFRAAWTACDLLANHPVSLALTGRMVEGVARGVDDHGALLIEHDGRLETFLSGHLNRR